ncbi:MAG: hypothetical protein J7M24_03120 [Candidatus Latescibacteria bacterium]|nr:hypothetical protein [Candidatus Latescibacterota bacterium]
MKSVRHVPVVRLSLLLALSIAVVYNVSGCGGIAAGVMDGKALTEMERRFDDEFAPSIPLSSHAFWHGENGEHWVLGLAEGVDGIIVCDARKGGEIRRIGKPGAEKGGFDEPAGIYVADDMAFVLERGNHRIQVIELPTCSSLGFFAGKRLADPIDFALYRIENGAFYLYVADEKKLKGKTVTHVLRYAVSRAVNTVHSEYQLTFGYSPGDGHLRNVASVAVDDSARQVLVTEKASGRDKIKVFSLDGDFIGMDFDR